MNQDTDNFNMTLMATIAAGNIDGALDLLFDLPYDEQRLEVMRNIAENLDEEIDTEATFAIASALNHAYVLFLNTEISLIRDLALANVRDRANALMLAHRLSRDFSDKLPDTPDLAPIFNRAIFLVRALERLLRVSK